MWTSGFYCSKLEIIVTLNCMIIHKTQQITKMRLKTAGVIGQQAILRLHEMKSMFYCSLSDLATTLRMFLLLRVFLSVYTCNKTVAFN